jgi:8-oxo-dGTP pyrophosphatase MutT (NUDIX family)
MMIKQLPLSIRPLNKTDVRSQFAALCYRIKRSRPEVLLVSSRGTGRWILPKGWPMPGLTPAATAAQEAWEEAGVVGTPIERCIGIYSFSKEMEDGPDLPCLALLYPVRVKNLAKDFPEAGQRRRKWLDPRKAATRVIEPELARLLRSFDPRALD